MSPRKRLAFRATALSLSGCLLSALVVQGADSPVAESMRRIFGSMQLLLPLSVDPDQFRDPAQAEAIRAALARVSDSAASVVEHAGSGDQGARFLGRSLEQEARRTARQFDRREYDSAQFSILLMTEYCVECHSRARLPADSPISRGFVAPERFAQLGPEERARLQFATRQFDAGLDTLERLLATPQVEPRTLLGAITNYLVVSIRVKRDLVRPAAALRTFAARPDLPTYLLPDVQRWVESLGSLSGRVDWSKPARLEDALALLSEARDVSRFRTDREALVQYIVASALLQRVVERPDTDADKAHAYYWLGLAELRMGRSYWLGLPEFFLETAIRLDPGDEIALQAYALIEEDALRSYALGAHDQAELPLDVESRLAELRRQIDAARRAPERPAVDPR